MWLYIGAIRRLVGRKTAGRDLSPVFDSCSRAGSKVSFSEVISILKQTLKSLWVIEYEFKEIRRKWNFISA